MIGPQGGRHRKRDMVLIPTEWNKKEAWQRVRFREIRMIGRCHVDLWGEKHSKVYYGMGNIGLRRE